MMPAMTGDILGWDAELSIIEAFLDRPGDGLRAPVLEGEAGVGMFTSRCRRTGRPNRLRDLRFLIDMA